MLRFVDQTLEYGLYEPEGIYLSAPFVGQASLLQRWGDNRRFYSKFRYNGMLLKGHPGVDFSLEPETMLLAADRGRVMEISIEPGGFGRYLKLEHRWGESFYAHLAGVQVEAGRVVGRGEELARSAGAMVGGVATLPHLHFAIRIAPYNRFDGWGGFADPLPYLDPEALRDEDSDDEAPSFAPPPMAVEASGMRRP